MSRLRVIIASTAVGVVCACNTPSVPLPPPDLPALGFADSGQPGLVVLRGKADSQHASVRFYVFDSTRGDGVITPAMADGSFTTEPFQGADGDAVQIYYDLPSGDRSQVVCVTLRLNATLFSQTCP
jgi:hypothetical protein